MPIHVPHIPLTAKQHVEQAKERARALLHVDEERAEHERELAEKQDQVKETRETIEKAKERLGLGDEEEGDDSSEIDQNQAEDDDFSDDEDRDTQEEDDNDIDDPGLHDSTTGGGDSIDIGNDLEDGDDEIDQDDFADDQVSGPSTWSPGSTVGQVPVGPERHGLLQHLKDVRKQTLANVLRDFWQTEGAWDLTLLTGITTVVGAGQISSILIQKAYDETFGAKGRERRIGRYDTERWGVDKIREYSRPYNEWAFQLGRGVDAATAKALAEKRMTDLVNTDLQLAKTKTAMQDFRETTHIKRYRRIIGSENPCALCLLASTQVYYSEDLMPIHPNCQCDVEPLADGVDPRSLIWIPASYLKGPKSQVDVDGNIIRPDLKPDDQRVLTGKAKRAVDIRRYLQGIADQYGHVIDDEPGGVKLDDLITVHEHGEMGPLLAWTGQKFTGPNDLPHKPSHTLAASALKAPEPESVKAIPPAVASARKTAARAANKPSLKATAHNTAVQRQRAVKDVQDAQLTPLTTDQMSGKEPLPPHKPLVISRRLQRMQIEPARAERLQYQADLMQQKFLQDNAIPSEFAKDADAVAAWEHPHNPAADLGGYVFVRDNGMKAASVTQIQDYLMFKHPDTVWSVAEFDATHVSVPAAKSVLKAADEMMTKYPDTFIERINPDWMGDMTTIMSTTPSTIVGETESILVNRDMLSDYRGAPAEFKRTMKEGVDRKWFFPGMDKDPWHNAFVHEYGHAMNNRGGMVPTLDLNARAVDMFKAAVPDYTKPWSPEEFKYWMNDKDRIAGYSLTSQKLVDPRILKALGREDEKVFADPNLNNGEAIAQAFEDVERRGDKASDLSQMMHSRLMEGYGKLPPTAYPTVPDDGENLRTAAQAIKAKADKTMTDAQAKIEEAKAKAQAHVSQNVGEVRIPYARNNTGMRVNAAPDAFGQQLEPWGRYATSDDGKSVLPPGWERGYVTFKKPLYVNAAEDWKTKLSETYGGATGKELSERILADGYDGVVAQDKYGVNEIVDIRPKAARGHVVTATATRIDPATEQAIYDAVKANGGVTIDLAGHSPTNGYAYAPFKGTEVVVPEHEFTQKHIDDYIDQHYAELEKPGNNLGMWTQDGNIYIDISRVGAANAKTIAAAQSADQLAVFDLKHFNEIETGTIKDGVYTPLGKASDIHNQYRAKIARANEKPSSTGLSEVSRGEAAAAKLAAKTERAALKDQAAAQAAQQAKLGAAEKARGFGSVEKRISAGETPKPIFLKDKDGKVRTSKVTDDDGHVTETPMVDTKATWAAINDETLKENWRIALRQSAPWAVKAGQDWYPGVHRLAAKLTDKYGAAFENRWGIPLTNDLTAAFFAAYSENNVWAGNLLGMRKFLDGSGSQYMGKLSDYVYAEARDYKGIKSGKYGTKYSVPSPDQSGYEIPGFAGKWKNYDFHVNKAIRAMQNPRGGVADLRENALGGPKPADFAANIAGDYSKATADRWVARILLHTDDKGFAEQMRGAAQTTKGVVDPYGYNRMSKVLQEVAAEPEFANMGLNAAATQAIPWVHVVGPLGSIGYIDDLTSVSTITAETLQRAAEFGDAN